MFAVEFNRRNPLLSRDTYDPDEEFLELIAEGAKQVWQKLASVERILRGDKPRGVLPSSLTARPKNRGLTPRHELWIG